MDCVWEPTADEPALIFVVDEYAELAEEAPEALCSADSIARRGRAVAETLLAATQHPTQQVMGRKAVRTQMDVRLCLRVRELRDVDLVLGQGMLAAGWTAHMLDAPGKFLLSAPGLDTPQRARSYLVTDADVRAAVSEHEPEIVEAEIIEPSAEEPDSPEKTLLHTLTNSPPQDCSARDLMRATGMGRTWVYQRLQEHAAAGRAVQVSRGRWRANPRDDGTESAMAA